MTTWLERDDRAGEPARDARLGALLRDVVGNPTAEVNWQRLASRIAAALPAPQTSPWWSYAERWQRRAVPLALAAGLIGVLVISDAVASTRAETVVPGASELLGAVMSGTSSADAARSYARSVTATIDFAEGVIE